MEGAGGGGGGRAGLSSLSREHADSIIPRSVFIQPRVCILDINKLHDLCLCTSDVGHYTVASRARRFFTGGSGRGEVRENTPGNYSQVFVVRWNFRNSPLIINCHMTSASVVS